MELKTKIRIPPTKKTHTRLKSTHAGHILLKTSKANEEPFQYVIKLNTKDGNFFVTDDVGNSVIINSPANQIILRNADDTLINLEDIDIDVVAQGDLTIGVGGDINITCENMTVNAESLIKFNCGVSSVTIGKYRVEKY